MIALSAKKPQRLLALRKRLKMSQREMAAEFLVSPGTIALWENGQRQIPGPVVRLIEIYEKAADKNFKTRVANGKEIKN